MKTDDDNFEKLVAAFQNAWRTAITEVTLQYIRKPGKLGWFPSNKQRAEVIYEFLKLSDKYLLCCSIFEPEFNPDLLPNNADNEDVNKYSDTYYTYGNVFNQNLDEFWTNLEKRKYGDVQMSPVEDGWQTILDVMISANNLLQENGYDLSTNEFLQLLETSHIANDLLNVVDRKTEVVPFGGWPQNRIVSCFAINAFYTLNECVSAFRNQISGSILLHRKEGMGRKGNLLLNKIVLYKLSELEELDHYTIATEHPELFPRKEHDLRDWEKDVKAGILNQNNFERKKQDWEAGNSFDIIKTSTAEVKELLTEFNYTGIVPEIFLPKRQ